MVRYGICVLLSASLSLTLGQPETRRIDPQARPFLEFTSVAEKSGTPVRTVDYTLCSTSYDGAPEREAGGEVCVRTVMDFVNRRMVNETAAAKGDGPAAFKMVYTDGQATITDGITGEPTPLPQEQAAIFRRSLDYAADVVETGGALPDEVLSATYDGVVKYGGVVSGEQITARVRARSFLLGRTLPTKTTMRFIFGSGKKLLAFTSKVAPGNLLHVLDNPDDPVPMRRFLSGTSYWLEDGNQTLLSAQHLTRYRLNPALSDALFTREKAPEGASRRQQGP